LHIPVSPLTIASEFKQSSSDMQETTFCHTCR
jgi:hypothetical protein